MKIAGIVILVLCASLAEANFVATISCAPCTISCAHAKCHQIKAQNYTRQVCGYQNCNDVPYNVTFANCTYDYLGQDCSTGVCLLPEPKGCASSTLGLNQCYSGNITQIWAAISCQSCSSQASCSKCLFYQESGGSGDYQTCLGSSCNGVQTLNISINRCQSDQDFNGNYCWCCYELTTQLTSRPGVCTSTFPLYSSAEFNTFARTYV